ncbi:MAG TPA: SpoIIE family protein phosphatase [Micromonosporaceae bacterium]|nr:SpoIIE family protein phosphatase [Micromonosporaceae bacterium]
MRNRAVIEQAKGLLAARLRVSPEDAFEQLLDLSQRTNTKLVEVAAALVGTSAPDPAHPTAAEIYSDDLRELVGRRRRHASEQLPAKPPTPRDVQRLREIRSPEREALQSQQQLFAARIASATSYEEIAQAIRETMTVWPATSSVVICLAELDGALRIVASEGLPPAMRSQWSRIPPQVDVPLTAAIREGKALLLSETDLAEHFPVVLELQPELQSLVCLPLRRDGEVLGVLGVSWMERMRLSGLNRRYLLALAESCGRAIRSIAGETETRQAESLEAPLTVEHRVQQGLLPMALDPLFDAVTVLAPITEGDQIIDFEFGYANQAAYELAAAENIDLDNTTLLEAFPEVGSRLLLGEYARVLRSGQPYKLDDLHLSAANEGLRRSYTMSIRVSRFADRLLVVWRVRTDADLLHDQLLRAERIARAGSFWWNLRSGDLRWSPGMYQLFGREPEAGAVGLDELASYIHPDDWLGVQNTMRRLLVGRTAELEFRLAGPAEGRRLRWRGEPVTDGSEVQAVGGTVRDVTGERAAEARLRHAEAALAAQRMRLESERHAAESLRDAVLPSAPQLAVIPGLTVRGLCRSPQDGGRVAGDWFDVLTLAERTLLVVGDVAGTGLRATTAATQLRSALRAYAVLGLGPAELLDGLNRMLCALDPDRMATLLIVEYKPRVGRLRWSAAGQAGPVRYTSAGEGSVLRGAIGVPIGAMPDSGYTDTELTLSMGERLLLYTDGLVGRREAGATDGIDVLLHAAQNIDLDDVEALVDHVVEKLGSEPHDDLCVVTAHVQ